MELANSMTWVGFPVRAGPSWSKQVEEDACNLEVKERTTTTAYRVLMMRYIELMHGGSVCADMARYM